MLEWDNVGSYNENTKELVITNALGLGDTIGKAKLNTPLVMKVPRGYQKVGEFDLWAYQDHNDVLKNLEVIDMNTNKKTAAAVCALKIRNQSFIFATKPIDPSN